MRPIIPFGVAVMLIFPAWFCLGTAHAQLALTPSSYGPYSGVFRPGGNGLSKPVEPTDTVLQATSPWSMYCWFQSQEPGPVSALLAGVGNPLEEYARYFALREGNLIFWMGEENSLAAAAAFPAGEWHFVAATFDGAACISTARGRKLPRGRWHSEE